jgi:hypothetical protein
LFFLKVNSNTDRQSIIDFSLNWIVERTKKVIVPYMEQFVVTVFVVAGSACSSPLVGE